MSHADDEEDFLDMLNRGDEPEPPKLLHAADPDHEESPPLLSKESTHVYHAMNSPTSASDKSSRFAVTLAEFYSIHNFGNLDKVHYLAEKFDSRRWELWEQLSIKYKLSPNESRLTWIKFNAMHAEIWECARRLFDGSKLIRIQDDASVRKDAWMEFLGLTSAQSEVEVYRKYVAEIESQDQQNEFDASEITRDVKRTHQELSFFHLNETQSALAQILTVYSKVNGIKYVQGMNEVLAVTLFVMREESTTFWAFNAIMVQLKDLFTAEADSTHDGIYYRIDSLNGLLREYDYKLWKHLSEIQFPLATLAMRWLTTLLSMDLQLPDVLRVWDIILQASSSHQLLTMSICLSLSYLLIMSESLLTIPDPQDSMELASCFGRGADFDVDDLILKSLSIYAFESTLRGRYSASSDEPLLDALVDVVGTASNRVFGLLNSEDVRRGRETLLNRVSSAGASVSGWLDRVVPANATALIAQVKSGLAPPDLRNYAEQDQDNVNTQ